MVVDRFTRRSFALFFALSLVAASPSCGTGANPEPLEISELRIEPGKPSTFVANGVRFFADDGSIVEFRWVRDGGTQASEILVLGQNLSLSEGLLRLGSRSFGSVGTGDEIRIEEGRLSVNGEARGRVTNGE